MKTKLVSLFVALFATTALWAYDFKYGDLYYDVISDNEVEVTRQWFLDELTVANIPSFVTYQGKTYNVTRIGMAAFSNCTSLTSVTIPNSVTSIGTQAFSGCTGLTSITIPNSVTSIGNNAFSGCTGLTSFTIPNSVTSIGYSAFYLCTSLTSIIWNAKSCMDCTRPFDDIETQITSFTIGDMVVTIPAYLCHGMEKLTTITIPNSVTSIGNCAFEKCTGLTSIVVKNGNTTYDSRNNCNAVIETKNNNLILGCQTTTIPNDVTSIGDSAFYNCTGLTSIAIPNSVINIGVSAFQGCTNLTHVALSNSLTSINKGVFTDCTSLTSIVIPDGVTSIGEKIEENGYFGGGYEGPFQNCTSLTSITIPSSVTSIGVNAFGSCSGLTSITIPNSVTSICSYAFSGCTGLTSITIPNSVMKIWVGAFAFCTDLTSITIGNNEHLNISWDVFGGCESLESVTCYAETPPMITLYEDEDEDGNPLKAGAFYGDELSEMKLYVPAKAIEQYKKAEEWKDFGQIIPIGATSIETNDDKPIVQPSLADVTITWKIVPNADTYTIAITRDAEKICTLVFDADGVLDNIAFAAPVHNGEQRHAPAAMMTEKGYRFTITGLERDTQYNYSISTRDKNGKELQTYSGTFKTLEEGSAVENALAGDAGTQRKVFRDGQVYILRGGNTYTLTGVEVK